uniref:Baseplate assembly protein n=1 Tax=Caudovirales sp. ctkvU4 TaxID=2826783 RepID=A0A8S5QQY9_9CAUD|nr:MAG TPA: baseplate assembly protein [Caudovirales sp. ctkvU4]
MERDVILNSKLIKNIDFAPATALEEIMQNVRTILMTVKFSVPLDRDFGIEGDIVDSPLDESAQAQLQAEIFDALRRYEHRVEVVQIQFKVDEKKGVMWPVVRIKIKEEYINEI